MTRWHCILGFLLTTCCLVASGQEPGAPEATIPGWGGYFPTIDGEWYRPPEFQKEWGWTKVAVISEFVTRKGEAPKQRTEVRAFYNAQSLYLAVTCFESEMKAVREGAKKERRPAPMPTASPSDSALEWLANTFEIFIRPEPSSPEFYQLAFNPSGHKFDQALGKDGTALWDADWQVATKLFDDRWQAEARISIASLAREAELRGTPPLGSHWQVTFCRASALGELSSWGKDGWHHPERGKLIFGPKPPKTALPPVPHDENDLAVSDVTAGSLEAGKGTFSAVCANPSDKPMDVEATLTLGELSRWAEPAKWTSQLAIPAKGKERLAIPYEAKSTKEPLALSLTVKRKDLTAPSYVAGARFRPFPVAEKLAETKQQLARMRSELQRLDPQGRSAEAKEFLAKLDGVAKSLEMVSRPGVEPASALAKLKEASADVERLKAPFGNRLRPALYLAHRGLKRPAFAIGLSHPTVKIFPEDGFDGAFADTVRLALARNEHESAQLVLLPVAEAPPAVSLKASPLMGPGGTSIPASHVEFHRVGWVTIHEPSLPVRQGLWPDPLYPTSRVELKPFQPQPVMVTVHAGTNQAPGRYAGTLEFSAEGYEPYRVALEVEVFPFTLPERSPFHNEFWFCPIRAQAFYGKVTPELFEQFASLLGRYRSPIYPFHVGLVQGLVKVKQAGEGKLAFDFSGLEPYLAASFKHGLTRLNITFTNYWQAWGKSYNKWSDKALWEALQAGKIKEEDFFRAYLVAIAEFLERKGYCTKERMFFIGGDEPWAKDVRDRMRPGYQMAKATLPWLKRTSAAAHPGIEGLDDLIDIWCPQVREFSPDAYKADKREVWMYTCGWKHPLPCFSIPVPGMSPRMLYWLCRKFGVTGFLYWGTNVWAVGNDINEVQKLPPERKPWVHDGWKRGFYVGDGYLLYPTLEGPIPSQRLLNIRDGVEDWLYLELLAQAIRGAEKAGKPVPDEARRLLAVPDAMVKSIREWNPSPEALEATRRQVARFCMELRSSEFRL